MKNILAYYYGLFIDELNKKGEQHFFKYGAHEYIFLPFNRTPEELEALYLLSIELTKSIPFYDFIILNKDQKIITLVDSIPFVLLRKVNRKRDKLSFIDINFNYIIPSEHVKKFEPIIRNNWIDLWKKKIDYFEYQMFHFRVKYADLMCSMPYFIGLGENAIAYIQEALVKFPANKVLVAGHRRILDIDEFYCPLNLVVDYKTRDIAEYLKAIFLHKNYDMSIIERLITDLNLDCFDSCLIFGRLMFPSFYFDCYEDIINGYKKEEEMFAIVDYIDEYERFLCDIYIILNKYNDLPPIDWLNRKKNI